MKNKLGKEKMTVGQLLEVIRTGQELQLRDREDKPLTGIETASFIYKTEKYLLTKTVENVYVAPSDTYIVIMVGKV